LDWIICKLMYSRDVCELFILTINNSL
jgi:hypothetical protein